MDIDARQEFSQGWEKLENEAHSIAVSKGWWEWERNDGEIIALFHSELSEAFEAIRNGNPASEKIPAFSQVEEELADVLIRIADYTKAKGYRLADAVVAKMEFNKTRPHRHGGKKC